MQAAYIHIVQTSNIFVLWRYKKNVQNCLVFCIQGLIKLCKVSLDVCLPAICKLCFRQLTLNSVVSFVILLTQIWTISCIFIPGFFLSCWFYNISHWVFHFQSYVVFSNEMCLLPVGQIFSKVNYKHNLKCGCIIVCIFHWNCLSLSFL